MTNNPSNQSSSPRADANVDDSNAIQPVRRRDKFRVFLGNLMSKASIQPSREQLPLQAAAPTHVAFQAIESPSDGYLSVSSSARVDKPLPAHPTEIKSIHYFFSENLLKPAIMADLLALHDRIESIQQLVYCSTLLLQGPASTNDKQELEWMAEMDMNPKSQDHLRWLVTRMVKEYAQDASKDSVKTAEIVALGPVLDREHYRKLLSSILGELDNARIVDFTLLHGLIQLIQSASPGFLEPDDLVRILRILRVRLEGIHEQSSEHTYYLALVVSRVLDVMADHGVKDLDRVVEHEPLSGVLSGLKGSSDPYLMYQACYAFQALQYVPDDETVLQAVLRHSFGVATGLVNITAVFKLGLGAVLEGLRNLQEALGETVKTGMTVYEGVSSMMESGQGVMDSLKEYYKSGKKRPWYAAIRAAHAFIQAGQLKDFNQLICEAPCRRDPLFQWGICQLLGEVASDTIWDIAVRQQAVGFLGELYRNDQEWAQDESVKIWMLNIVGQLGVNADQAVSTSARALLQELEQDQDAATTMSRLPYPLRSRLPLPSSSPILTRVQNISCLEYDLDKLKLQRLGEHRKGIYIPPQAKPSLQATDDTSFPLTEKMDEFLAGPWQVFLILGDSGAGKSTFNHELEHTLWQNYKRDGPIPLFISLPTIDNPAQDLIGKELRYQNFSEEQMRELKLHRQFIVICDGYDESQLKTNLHSANEFNQPGQWKVKMVVSCRSQYLGQGYRSWLQPRPTDRYARASPDLMMKAVIVPFSKAQIEQYIEQYVKKLPADDVDRDRPAWTKEEYMERLTKIPKLLELVSNPFLLTLSLEALPEVIGSKKELSAIRITRVRLYDGFVNRWLEVNKRRLEDSTLSESERSEFDMILDDGFLYHGIKFQKELAAAIFQKQEGQPVVSYTHLHDGSTWKSSFFSPVAHTKLLRESSTVTRSGRYFRFIHRSLLEYFYSRTIYDPLDCDADIASDDSPSTSTAKSGLAQMSITNEPSIMQFLAERVHEDQTFKNKLHQVIELSKADSQASQAASNAISILIQAGVHFNGADLQGVRVPKADLTGGQFDSAQFQGADLTGANLTMSWIWQADFSNAQMAEVQFGELPSLQESSHVKCCAYSSNEQKFAVGLWNGKIRLYDTITWKVRVLHGHRSAVSSISFSCTGNQLISGGDDSTVQIWDPQEGKVRVRRKVLLCKATCVAFSPKDQHVALATEQYSVGIWNVKSDKDFVLRGHTAPVTSVAWSPSGHQIASGSRDGTIRLWNSETWILSLVLNSIASPASGVCCIAYSPDGRRIVAGDDNGELKLWNSMANELEHSMKGHYSTVNGVTFSKDGQWIASCSYDKSVRLWDAKAHVGVSIMNGHLNPVYGVAFSPDDLQIVSCSSDRTVRRWDVSTKGASLASHIDPGEVSIVAYSLDGQYILSGYQRLRKWDALTGASTSLRLDLPITCMAFSPSGCQIATDSGDVTSNIWSRNIWKDNDIRLWHSQTGVAEDVLCGHTDRVTSLAYSPCGRWIASSSRDKTLRLWDLHNALQVLTLKGHIGEVNAVVFSPDGLQIASGGADGTIRLWQPDTGDCTVVLKGHSRGVTAVAYSSDNLQIVSSCEAGSIRLWQVESRTSSVLHGDDEGMIWSASFSPCCKWIAATFLFARQEEDDDYEALRLWKVDESGNWLSKTVPQGLFNFVSSVAWNPFFPNQFVTGFWDRSVSVWSLAEEQDDADVSLLWTVHPGRLNAMGAKIKDAVDLSLANRKLLSQHGAIGETLVYESDESESVYENDESESDESESDESESDESESVSESDESESDESESDESESVSESDESESDESESDESESVYENDESESDESESVSESVSESD